MTSYRYPGESMVLFLTIALVLVVIAVSATATLCLSLVFIALAVGLAISASNSHHRALMAQAYPVSQVNAPELAVIIQRCLNRLQPGRVVFYVAPSRDLNAYTFGLDTPKVVVLYSQLFKLMDADEISFIIGHELGHVALGHTWLNSLVGGMAGIPSSGVASAILTLAFLWWNRSCEYSADRAGLLACGRLDKAETALIKLVAGAQGLTRAGLERAYQEIDAEDDHPLHGVNEVLGTHPMLIKRINEMRSWAQSDECRRLQGQVEKAA